MFEQSHGVAEVIATQGIRTDQFGEQATLVDRRAFLWTHLNETHTHPGFGQLPSSFGTSKTPADDEDLVAHSFSSRCAEKVGPSSGSGMRWPQVFTGHTYSRPRLFVSRRPMMPLPHFGQEYSTGASHMLKSHFG